MSIMYLRKFRLMDYIAFTGTVASIVGLLIMIVPEFAKIPRELLMASGTVLVTFLSGVFSHRLSDSLKHFSYSQRVFLASTSDLQKDVDIIATAIRYNGARVWLYKDRLHAGDSSSVVISKAIDDADSFVVILGKKMPQNLMQEIKIAKQKNKKIIPVLLGGARVPEMLKDLVYVDLSHDRDQGIQKLVKAIM